MSETSEQIEEEVARWLIEYDADSSPEKGRELEMKLARSPVYRAAFIRLSTAWDQSGALRQFRLQTGGVDKNALSPRVLAARFAAAGRPRPRIFGLRPAWASSVAAAASIAVLAAGFALWRGEPDGQTAVYSTEIGRIEHILLRDGSTIDLNTNSTLEVSFNPVRRALTLLQGEAAFNVAQNRNRPFDVTAGAAKVRALGTAFSIRLRDDRRVDVRVTEGRVAINPPAEDHVLTSGQEAAIADHTVSTKETPVEILTNRLAWTKGRLFFNGDTLAEAVEEFNRYNALKIEIADPSIASARITSTFDARDPRKFVASLAAPFHIKELRHGHGSVDSNTLRIGREDSE